MQTPRQSSKLQTQVHIISHPNCEVFHWDWEDAEVLSDANLLVRERVNMEFQQNDLGLRMGHTQLHGISLGGVPQVDPTGREPAFPQIIMGQSPLSTVRAPFFVVILQLLMAIVPFLMVKERSLLVYAHRFQN